MNWSSGQEREGKRKGFTVPKLFNFRVSEGVINSKGRTWAGTMILEELEEYGECKDLGATEA